MRKVFFLLFLVLGVTSQAVTREWFEENYSMTEVMISMRDGVRLHTVVYAPKDQSLKSPILMERSPYGMGVLNPTSGCWDIYLRNHYILVYQDVRGRNQSEGTFEQIHPFIEKKHGKQIDEASDTYDTADWLIKHTHNNGCMGVQGISYGGFYSTMAALSGHPAIKAVSPQAPVTDWFKGDDAHHNGAFFQTMFSFCYWFDFLDCAHPAQGPNPTHFDMADQYEGFLRMGAIKNLTKLVGDSCSMWMDNVRHPNEDQWWLDRLVTRHCYNVKPAVMVVGGMFDAEDCYGALATYRAIQQQSPKTELYLVEGPWAHGAWSGSAEPFFGDVYVGDSTVSSYYNRNIEYPFFAYYLEGKGEKPAKARVYQTGENEWREYAEGWTPDEPSMALYLQPNGKITSDSKLLNGEEITHYTSDPAHPVPYTAEPVMDNPETYMIEDQRFASTRPDVVTFSTDVLTDTLRLDGPIVADLNVAIDATDVDLIVKVIDVFPDGFQYPQDLMMRSPNPDANMSGYQMLVRAEVMRGKYRNSYSNPEPFVPGEATQVRYTLNDVAHTWLPGHKLMIQVQSTWFPLVDRNPQQFCDIYQCEDSDFRACEVRLLSPSRILVSPQK